MPPRPDVEPGCAQAWKIPESMTIDHVMADVAGGPVLGIDWGKTRVGIALTNPEGTVAMPLEVVSAGPVLRYRLLELWSAYGVRALIMGWPVHADGNGTPLCGPIGRLAERLRHDHGWPVALWDETLTTYAAEDQRVVSGQRRREGRSANRRHSEIDVDAHAAAVILQEALDWWRLYRRGTANSVMEAVEKAVE